MITTITVVFFANSVRLMIMIFSVNDTVKVNVDDDNGKNYFVDSGKPYLRGEDRSHSSPLGKILCKDKWKLIYIDSK